MALSKRIALASFSLFRIDLESLEYSKSPFLYWQGTEIDPTICKVSEKFFQPDNMKVLVKLPIKMGFLILKFKFK